jgi:hypothetical protein
MDPTQNLRVMADMVEKFTRPLKAALTGRRGVARSLNDTRRALAEMGKTQQYIAQFRALRGALAATASQLDVTRARVTALAAALRAGGPPSRQMLAEFHQAKRSAAQLATVHDAQVARVQALRSQLAHAGVSTRQLVHHERTLRASIASTTASMNQQLSKLDALNARKKRLAEVRRHRHDTGRMLDGSARWRADEDPIDYLRLKLGRARHWLSEAIHAEREAMRIDVLGAGQPVSANAMTFAREMKTVGVSISERLTMMRKALPILGNEHDVQMALPALAKVKFLNEVMFDADDARANTQTFMTMLPIIQQRGGMRHISTFEREASTMRQMLTATQARVGVDQWRAFIQAGGAAAKQLRGDAFFLQMEPLIDAMHGHAAGAGLTAAYSHLYEGKTTLAAAKQMIALGLLNPKKIEYTKLGAIKAFQPDALAGSEILKASPFEWLEQVLLPKLRAHGITDPDKIKNVIPTMLPDRAAAEFFSTLYRLRTAIHHNAQLGAGIDGIDALHTNALQITRGREVAALAQLRDLMHETGQYILPMYNEALAYTTALTEKWLTFMREHPAQSKVVVQALAGVAAILAAISTLSVALAGILAPLAIVKYSLATLGLQGGTLSRLLGTLLKAWRLLGHGIILVGRVLLANPIGLAITAIAFAAFQIYRYWGPIQGFFSGLWKRVQQTFDGALSNLTARIGQCSPLPLFKQAFTAVLQWFDSDLPATFWKFGAKLMSQWVTGIRSQLAAVKETITEVANRTVEWFQDKLRELGALLRWACNGGLMEIGTWFIDGSPIGLFYRAFAAVLQWFGIDLPKKFSQFGVNVMLGLANGIKSQLGAVKDAITEVANSTVTWFKERLGMHSPSRIFGELGGFIGQGAARGIEGEQSRVARAALALASVAVSAFAAPAVGASAFAASAFGAAVVNQSTVPFVRASVPIDARASVTRASAAASADPIASSIVIHVHPPAGADTADIARMVRAEFERAQQAKLSRAGSRLSD